MKYLDVTLDSGNNFRDHFRVVLKRMEKMVTVLCRLMPNLRGSSEWKKRLYAFVIRSVLMYRTPVWADVLSRDCTMALRASCEGSVH